MMSLVYMPAMFRFFWRAWVAQWRAPSRPCSSAATAMKTMVASNLCLAITQASSMVAAVPEASSLAPGASAV